MPTISLFYGMIVSMFYYDNKQHNSPHIHVSYQDFKAVFSIPEGILLEGKLPPSKQKILCAWIEIHQEDLMADWHLAVNGQVPHSIEPLR